jgi:hypothetical protein
MYVTTTISTHAQTKSEHIAVPRHEFPILIKLNQACDPVLSPI